MDYHTAGLTHYVLSFTYEDMVLSRYVISTLYEKIIVTDNEIS